MKKFWLAGLICVAFLAIPLHVRGAGAGIFLESCRADESGIEIVCANPADGESFPDKEAFSVRLDGEELCVDSVSSVGDEELPVTVYCLVDVSGSMSEGQMQQAKDALYSVCDGLCAGDSMVIATLGNQTVTSGFLTDKSRMEETIEGLAAGNEDTNLYSGIVESLGILKTDTRVSAKRCLIILSDGEDDQKTGITKEEAERSVTDSRIPVYTVATLPQNPDDSQTNYAKLLGSFARMSAGGEHYAPSVDGISAKQAGGEIMRKIKEGLVLRTATTAVPHGSDGLELRVAYTSPDGSRYEDSMIVYAENLLEVGEDAETESAEESKQESVSETDSEEASVRESQEEAPESEEDISGEESSDSEETGEDSVWDKLSASIQKYMWFWIAGVAAVAVIIIVLIAVIIVRRRNKAKAAVSAGSGAGNNGAVIDGGGFGAPVAGDRILPRPEVYSEETVQVRPLKKHTLVLKAVGYEQIERRIELPEGVEVTVGRNDKADIVLDPGDKRLSGVHCMMKWENGKLHLCDLNSKNGTFVNGVPIMRMGSVAVHDGETIRMGSYEYRVSETQGV